MSEEDDIDAIYARRTGRGVKDIDETRKRELLRRKDYLNLKAVVRHAKYNDEIDSQTKEKVNELYSGKDKYAIVNKCLVWADENRKKGKLNSAANDLDEASAFIGYSHDIKEGPDTHLKGAELFDYNLNRRNKNRKYAQAIADRAVRVFRDAENDLDATKKSYLLIKKLRGAYDVKLRKRRSGLESAVTAILGFGLGLFFLSPNITGNVVGNASMGVSNWVGALLFGVGIIGAWSWVRNR